METQLYRFYIECYPPPSEEKQFGKTVTLHKHIYWFSTKESCLKEILQVKQDRNFKDKVPIHWAGPTVKVEIWNLTDNHTWCIYM